MTKSKSWAVLPICCLLVPVRKWWILDGGYMWVPLLMDHIHQHKDGTLGSQDSKSVDTDPNKQKWQCQNQEHCRFNNDKAPPVSAQ